MGDFLTTAVAPDEGATNVYFDPVDNTRANEGEESHVDVDVDGNGHKDDKHGHNPAKNMGATIRLDVDDLGYGMYTVGMTVVANNNGTGARGTVGGDGMKDLGAKTTLR